MVKLVYFAWVRERIGKREEELSLPAHIETISDLIAYLKTRDEAYEAAFQEPDIVRVALDQEHMPHHTKIGSAREIAFFPPMTGG